MANYTAEDLLQIAEIFKSIQVGQKHDPASTVTNWVGAHGPGGLFSRPGIRPDMFSTVPRPIGLTDMIRLIGSPMINERYAILTGVTATEGTRAVDICSEGPTPGKLKVCHQNIPFGEMKIDTPTLRDSNLGQRIDYSDLNRNVLNLENVGSPMLPAVLNSNNVDSDEGKVIYETYLAIEKSITRADINGVAGTVGTPPGEALFAADYLPWIIQYDGLGRLIRTGYADQPTGVACAAADSVVVTHNALVSANGTNGQSFISNVVNAIRSIVVRAQRIGMGDFDYAILMHPNAAWAIYDQWACNYNTDRCTGAAGNEVIRYATDVVQFRDAMRNGNYLLTDGRTVPVIFSDGMQWDGTANNTFNTDIFVIPLQWRGRPLLYRQFFPLNNSARMGFNAIGPNPLSRVINNGLYEVGQRTTNGMCTKFEFYSKTRLILDTPFLAARINDVQVTYNISGNDVFPGMSSYRDGGQSTQF